MTLAQLLKETFEERKARNPRYSMRAFARDLDLDASNLSKLLKQKRAPSAATLERLQSATRTNDPKLHMRLTQVFARASDGFFELDPVGQNPDLMQWRTILVLESLNLFKDGATLADIKRVTRLVQCEVRDALERLERLGLICKDQKASRYIPSMKDLGTGGTSTRNSAAYVAYQKQLLHRAIQADLWCEPEERSQTSMVFCVERARVADVHREIKRFRRNLGKLLDGGTGRNDSVYALCVSLFPLTGDGAARD